MKPVKPKMTAAAAKSKGKSMGAAKMLDKITSPAKANQALGAGGKLMKANGLQVGKKVKGC